LPAERELLVEMSNPGPRRSLLRDRDFVLMWGGQTVSQTGSQVTVLALPLVAIVVLNASTFQVGLLSVMTTSAYLFASLPAGMLIDRGSKRRTMLVCDLVALVTLATVPVADAAGILTLAQLYATALVASICSTFFLIAYSSYLPALIPPDRLLEGNGKLSVSQSSAQFAGPSLGALLVGLVGAATAMAADAASFAVSALCLLAIRTREPPAGLTARSQRLRAQLGVGTSYVLSDPILRKSVAWSGTANFFVIIVETLGPLFLVRGDHVNPALVGVLLALGATGGIAGGLLCQPLARRLGSARLTWLSVTAFTLPGLLIPLAGPGWSMLLFAAGWISWSFGSTLCGVALISYQQRTSPPQLRGQVAAAVRWINWGTLPLGGLTAGALGGVLGVHTMLWIAVVGGCSAGMWLYRSPLRFLRDMPITALQLATPC
jgi:MFS family permease